MAYQCIYNIIYGSIEGLEVTGLKLKVDTSYFKSSRGMFLIVVQVRVDGMM